MKIVVAVKVVLDDQDIFVAGDRTLDASKAKPKISEYDKNAIEAAAQFAAANAGSSVIAISAMTPDVNQAKVKQNILALGVDELFLAADDSLKDADSYATAQVLKGIVEANVPDYDVIICGDGSADMYAGQVNIQLAAALGVPTINAVTKLTAEGDKLVVDRVLDEEIEEVEIPLPAVVSVSPDVANPRIAGMRDIMQAKKKPQNEVEAAPAATTVTIEEIKAPELAPRKNQIFEEGDIDAFVAAVAEAIK